MSLKDKLKNKVRKNQNIEPQPFDQSALNITLSPIGSQLTPVTVTCDWAVPSPLKPPTIECRWFNRTANNIAEIEAVQGQQYQPCLADVGSIIEVSCMPQGSYQGMPFLLKTPTVTLAPTTQQQATQMLQTGRGRFTVDLRQGRIKGRNVYPGMQIALRVEATTLAICLMRQGAQQILKEVQIDELFPQLTQCRPRARELSIRLSEQQHCTVLFRTNEIRDIFCLLNKMIIATGKAPSSDSLSTRPRSPNEHPQHPQTISEDDLTEKQKESAPVRNQSVKASDLLQIANLRQELRSRETEVNSLKVDMNNQKERVRQLQSRLSQTKERLQSVTRNYFELEKELEASKGEVDGLRRQIGEASNQEKEQHEEAVYYKNETAILGESLKTWQQKGKALEQRLQVLELELKGYRQGEREGQGRSYGDILVELKHQKQLNSSLKLKQQYSLSERQQLQDQLRDSRTLLEQAHSANHYLSKKCDALASQISSPLPSSKLSDSRSDHSPSRSMQEGSLPDLAQMQELRRQLQQLIAQNKYVRGLLQKQKKPTSRSHLKLQLYQVKKLVNRLSQNISQKDMCIAQLKTVNRDLNTYNVHLQQQIHNLQNHQQPVLKAAHSQQQ